MNIAITARKFKAQESLKEFIKDEISGLTRYNEDLIHVDVILSYINNRENLKSAEIIVQVPGQILSAKEDTDDFRKSVSAASEKLVRQLKKLKTKRTSRVK
jgi:putative sigma-54 modulation protein